MSNPLGLKNQYKRLAKGLDQLLEQQQFTRWFYNIIASLNLNSDKKKKLQFILAYISAAKHNNNAMPRCKLESQRLLN